MYATDVFDFNASDNSKLISLNFVIRATFLTFAFPVIIDTGRKWLDRRQGKNRTPDNGKIHVGDDDNEDVFDRVPDSPELVAASALPAGEASPDEPDEPLRRVSTAQSGKSGENESFAFDLFYARWSLLLDGVLTSLATFTGNGWQMYIVAVVIPFAAGTGSAAKGTSD